MAGVKGMKRLPVKERRALVSKFVRTYGISDSKRLTARISEEVGYRVNRQAVVADLKLLYGASEAWVHDQSKRTWMVKMEQMSAETNEEIEMLRAIMIKLERATNTSYEPLFDLVESLEDPAEHEKVAPLLEELARAASLKSVAPTLVNIAKTNKELRTFLTELTANKPIFEHVQEAMKRFESMRVKEGGVLVGSGRGGGRTSGPPGLSGSSGSAILGGK